MSSWRDELVETIKTKAEREAEEQERSRQRLAAALLVAEEALGFGRDGLRFTREQLAAKEQPGTLDERVDGCRLELHGLSIDLGLSRTEAVIKVAMNDAKPREFDFAKDRHISPKDVEEYVGRRVVELVRAAQKSHPW